MNLYRYEIYMKPGRNAWCLVSRRSDLFCPINIWLTQKHTGLRFLDPVWDLLSFARERYEFRQVREFPLPILTETKSDRSLFIVGLVSCKRIKRNVWRPIRSHAVHRWLSWLSTGLSRGRSWVQLRPDQHSGSWNNWGESAAFVTTSANG